MSPYFDKSRLRLMRSTILVIIVGSAAVLFTLLVHASQNPHGFLEYECEFCHLTESWTELREDMQFSHATTAFPLQGQHENVNCRSCHNNLKFSEVSVRCLSCHLDIHDNQFGDDCGRCHNSMAWIDEVHFRQMHQGSRFPLLGAHGALDCQLCHIEGRYVDIPLDCYGCHLDTYNSTVNPDHQSAGFPVDCGECHGFLVSSWTGNLTNFRHTSGFPLVGGHTIGDCQICHLPGSLYSQTSSECYACHQSDYEGTNDPDHIQGNFGTNCAVCHSIMVWRPAVFDHDMTDFPLTGAHTSLDCNNCHLQGYTGTSKACISCHQAEFESASDPIHSLTSFGSDCSVCHATTAWIPSTFDHNAFTDYDLSGAHVELDCALCHIDGIYAGTAVLCFGCHQQDYETVQDPNHVASLFPTECDLCHSTETWEDAFFDHDQSDFPLTGAHIGLDCQACHSEGYTGTSTECYACHEANYSGAVNPVHTPPSFDFDCTVCHNTTAWSPSSFDHNQQTDYELTGSHVNVNCILCHVNGQYENTPTACFFCHEDDYLATNNPSHEAAGFPTECEQCHNTITWQDATFDHDNLFFPIYSGSHREAWDSCTDCHIGGNFNDFSCIDCHEHNRTEMDDEHDEVAGYVYESHACLECHPDGSETLRKGPKRSDYNENKNK